MKAFRQPTQHCAKANLHDEELLFFVVVVFLSKSYYGKAVICIQVMFFVSCCVFFLFCFFVFYFTCSTSPALHLTKSNKEFDSYVPGIGTA